MINLWLHDKRGTRRWHDAWKETEHPRGGNPQNPGQFSTTGGSKATAPKAAKPEKASAPAEPPKPQRKATFAVPSHEDQRQNAEGITQWVSMLGIMQNRGSGGENRSPSDIMLEHGRQFLFDEDSNKCKQGQQKQCFMNAAKAAIYNPDLTYVEGYVTAHGVPIEHAWCVDKSGKVIDPTIRDLSHIGAYVGIPIKTKYLTRTLFKNKVYGILDPMINFERLKLDPADYVEPDIGEKLPVKAPSPEEKAFMQKFLRGEVKPSEAPSPAPRRSQAPPQEEEEEPAPFSREGGLDPLRTTRVALADIFTKYTMKRLEIAHKTNPASADYPEQLERAAAEMKPVVEETQQKLAAVAGEAMGVDPARVYFSDEHPTSKVGDRSFNVGGFAYHASGRIEMFGVDQPGMQAAGTLVHEMMHVKFESVRQRRNDEYRQWIEASKEEDPGDPLMTRAGYMTDKAKERWPLLADWEAVMHQPGQWQKLVEDDGITDYSREWWQAFKDSKANGDQAAHETLAEMAKLDLEGSLDRLLWFKQSNSWKPLYELVNKHYAAAKDDRDHTGK